MSVKVRLVRGHFSRACLPKVSIAVSLATVSASAHVRVFSLMAGGVFANPELIKPTESMQALRAAITGSELQKFRLQ
jgi:hypothetical protein